MSLDYTIRHAELAQIELRSMARSAQGWKDTQREEFNNQHMTPLDDAASRLLAALRRADDQLVSCAGSSFKKSSE